MSMSLPHALRRIRLDPSVISALAVPSHAQATAESWEIDVVALGDQPLPRADLADWLGCIQAHPHSDPDFADFIFVTLAVQAEHRFELMFSPGKVVSMTIRPGDLFAFNPVHFHWLRAEGNEGFLSVQWAVPKADFVNIYREIRRGLAVYGIKSSKLPATLSNWKASIGEQLQ